jgi:hypothetical protein
VWRLRLLLALMLLFGSEILLWTDPFRRLLTEWIVLIVGYVALASLLLDFAARFRVRNIFGLLALAGIYGLLGSLLLNPDTTLTDVPRTLFTRVLGGHTFAGLLMLALFLRLQTPGQMSLLRGAAAGGLVGLGWGTWARWSPTLLRPDATDTPLSSMVALAAAAFVLMLVLLLLRRDDLSADVRLQPLEWIGVAVVLIGMLVIRGLTNQIDTFAFVLIAMLGLFCLVLLWFLRRRKGHTLLDGIGAVNAPLATFAALIVSFAALALVGYGLRRGEGAQDPVFLITVLMTAFGIAWLPGVSLALGAQAVARQVRAGKL